MFVFYVSLASDILVNIYIYWFWVNKTLGNVGLVASYGAVFAVASIVVAILFGGVEKIIEVEKKAPILFSYINCRIANIIIIISAIAIFASDGSEWLNLSVVVCVVGARQVLRSYAYVKQHTKKEICISIAEAFAIISLLSLNYDVLPVVIISRGIGNLIRVSKFVTTENVAISHIARYSAISILPALYLNIPTVLIYHFTNELQTLVNFRAMQSVVAPMVYVGAVIARTSEITNKLILKNNFDRIFNEKLHQKISKKRAAIIVSILGYLGIALITKNIVLTSIVLPYCIASWIKANSYKEAVLYKMVQARIYAGLISIFVLTTMILFVSYYHEINLEIIYIILIMSELSAILTVKKIIDIRCLRT